jgi:glycosyltransferase involved in cell wall biosynthesis
VYCRSLLDGLAAVAAPDDRFEVFAPADPKPLFPASGIEPGRPAALADPRFALHLFDWPAGHPLADPLDVVLADRLRAVRPDVFHCSYFTALLRPVCPQAVTFHDAGFLEFPHLYGPRGEARRAAVAKLRDADSIARIIGDSSDARRRLCKAIPFPEPRAEAVLLPLTDPPAAVAAAVSARDRRGSVAAWPGGETLAEWGRYLFVPVGAATGVARGRKNIPTAVRAFRRLSPAGVGLVIASNAILAEGMLADLLPPEEIAAGGMVGPADGRLRMWRSADGAVRVLPDLARPEFLAAMACSAGVVYPSRYEGFGLPSVEAMAVGVPLVAAAATSIPEVAGDAAILVDPDDVPGFASAMGRVLSDPAVSADLVARGRRRLSEFTLARFGADNLAVYRRTMGL